MPDAPLSSSDISIYLAAVSDQLGPVGPMHIIVVAGGSLLAWHGLRDTTADVDSIKPFDDELRRAVAKVAEVHDLDPHWLNDSAAMFRPVTLSEARCELLAQYPRLRVLGAPLQQVFVMKLYAARTTDHADLRTMWNLCGFASPEEAADLFHQAYPHLEYDPFLADYIARIAAEAGS